MILSLYYSCMYNFKNICISGQWIVPDVIGEGPPPCHGFTLTPLPRSNRAVFFGGITSHGYCNTVYLGECTKTAVVSIYIFFIFYYFFKQLFITFILLIQQ